MTGWWHWSFPTFPPRLWWQLVEWWVL